MKQAASQARTLHRYGVGMSTPRRTEDGSRSVVPVSELATIYAAALRVFDTFLSGNALGSTSGWDEQQVQVLHERWRRPWAAENACEAGWPELCEPALVFETLVRIADDLAAPVCAASSSQAWSLPRANGRRFSVGTSRAPFDAAALDMRTTELPRRSPLCLVAMSDLCAAC